MVLLLLLLLPECAHATQQSEPTQHSTATQPAELCCNHHHIISRNGVPTENELLLMLSVFGANHTCHHQPLQPLEPLRPLQPLQIFFSVWCVSYLSRTRHCATKSTRSSLHLRVARTHTHTHTHTRAHAHTRKNAYLKNNITERKTDRMRERNK